MKAMVLAAGEGTRLRPLTLALPKPMIPIANTPLLVRTLRLLAQQGFTEIALNLYHRPEAIRQALGNGESLGVHLHYSDETTLMGTAGGVKRMEPFLDETFLILYGDNLYHADFAPLIAFHRRRKAIATIATFTAPNPSACGLVITESDGRVTRFQEKPPADEVFTDQANAGVYILEPEIFYYIPANTVYDFGKDVFPALLADNPNAMYALPLNGYLQDTGTLSAYRQANNDLIEGKAGPAEPAIHPTALIAEDAVLQGKNMIGAGCRVGRRAVLRDTILWDNVTIGDGAEVTNAILGQGVTVGAGAEIEFGSILASGVTIAPNTRIPSDTRLEPGTVFG
jgi:NDP-sugar pyrophosphorylase family protein